MLACVLPLAWLSLIPEQLHDLAQGLIGAATFTANIELWLSVGYFADEAEENLLLHL